ncbi:CAP domain-containing protein, partial [Streptomyces sp. T-3]|nr:CAP domain-containing protein [Streptomyces sp. T-3]
TGLLGVSAAVALGAVAVASGLLPGGDNYQLGGDGDSGKVRAASSPSDLQSQGGANTDEERKETAASRGSERPEASKSPSSEPSAKPSKTPSQKPSSDDSDKVDSGKDKATTPSRDTSPETKQPSSPSKPSSNETSAESQVLALVNQERAKAGCSPVRADGELADLAGAFSKDMADRGFFDHTDPDGATPWDRADSVGIANLGGENIARGQANAQSVMDSWMNSPGHRANILNCDYKTLGVGAYFGPGGPWWTQDFGF